ncbi:MAG: hypothetical protein A2487_06255 [Candidatus Raymondbacteria bacterium RifOxyC12_full_50_8]|uniref:Biopolymer transporter ExbD n=1 Tax=Candidatus Raymondbacteria bacterium RIFOXYD12_FULL_49_13 TaxID=1817890 RepID=A0A1F7FC58_UNCRA|nr:MAG: hypothetical protein A2248_03155 [Candidatus Raymondbacteria bacterium RIFOXYA2_FULL_49_16]OGJ93303.1 MAG: hypothetical protein A2350_14640 [Candidatus Raymondbacteria bacterium RifOxyB12_full_50_8]OGK04264.1 MAG: hypothetical protein A2519_18050 [Candidatus Raymondbacteria bacterium RIFOXYD12_FULL_49_13]OGK06050.1 MAG: hypothetical protein A2487_06255 [Candidatus Raymondbacteria bacterium RifOxyC12_full_50_8]OGP42453.1 MAG: hypothetical protein A2324_17190 [Candidatus Raymondbacteria b
MKLRTDTEDTVNINSLVDCITTLIIFFMVIMSATYIYGVAIKFPIGGSKKAGGDEKKEKDIVVFVGADLIEKDHYLVRDGLVKINGEEFALTASEDRSKWDEERKKAFDYLQYRISECIKQGYKKDVLIVQGDITTYHEKIMQVIDRAKAVGMKGFSLIPPS